MSQNMTADELRDAVLRNLAKIAPEADFTRLDPALSFREQLDIDSMDYFNFVLALHKELKVEIAEKDYPKLASLKGCMDFLSAAGPLSAAR